MPSSYLIDVANGVIYARKWGVLTDEQVASSAFEWVGMDATAPWPTQPPDAMFGQP
jgi:hypothetical protein